jgi:hypothetical protein
MENVERGVCCCPVRLLRTRKAFHFCTRNTRNDVKHTHYQCFEFFTKCKYLIISIFEIDGFGCFVVICL